jgi:hypothetical protein
VVEAQIGAPRGTIRTNGSRQIPAKYRPLIEAVAIDYGYDHDVVNEPKHIIDAPIIDIVDNNMMEFTYRNDSIQLYDRGIWRRAKLKPGCIIYVDINNVI